MVTCDNAQRAAKELAMLEKAHRSHVAQCSAPSRADRAFLELERKSITAVKRVLSQYAQVS